MSTSLEYTGTLLTALFVCQSLIAHVKKYLFKQRTSFERQSLNCLLASKP